MVKELKKISTEYLKDFYDLFSNDNCEQCQCTFYFCAYDIEGWENMSIEEVKELRKEVTTKYGDGYLYYFNGEAVAWVQCMSPNYAPYFKKLLNLSSDESNRVISCFYIKKQYRGKGLQNELLEKVIEQCKKEDVAFIYAIPVFEDFLDKIEVERKNEKLHTGYKKLYDRFDFEVIGNNGRYYFMKMEIQGNHKILS